MVTTQRPARSGAKLASRETRWRSVRLERRASRRMRSAAAGLVQRGPRGAPAREPDAEGPAQLGGVLERDREVAAALREAQREEQAERERRRGRDQRREIGIARQRLERDAGVRGVLECAPPRRAQRGSQPRLARRVAQSGAGEPGRAGAGKLRRGGSGERERERRRAENEPCRTGGSGGHGSSPRASAARRPKLRTSFAVACS